jgi:hypothetical protein
MTKELIEKAVTQYEALLAEQIARSEKIKQQGDFLSYSDLDTWLSVSAGVTV